jgi:23S rRNA (guanosine2251-2'-O)-methyltransferase
VRRVSPGRRSTVPSAPRSARGGAPGGGASRGDAEWIFGIHPVRQAIESGRSIAVIQRAREVGDGRLQEVVRLAEARGIGVIRVPRAQLDRLAGFHAHQGIAAQCSPVRILTLSEALEASCDERDRLWMMLDGVTDEGNAGSLVRSALALGASAVLAPSSGSVRPHAGLDRCSSGALSVIRWISLVQPADQLASLRRAGFRLLGAVVENGRRPARADCFGDRVLILGSEERGLRPAIEEMLDVRLAIRTSQAMPSLNVAAAGAILLDALREPHHPRAPRED